MKQYLEYMNHVLESGIRKSDRTGTGTMSAFGYQIRYDLQEGFPLITTKDMSGSRWEGIVNELLWFLDGNTNVKTLIDKGTNIWVPDAHRAYKERTGDKTLTRKEFVEKIKSDETFASLHGDLGRIYGAQWCSWRGVDGEVVNQIENVVKSIKENPDSRRHIVTAWNPAEVDDMALPPCHVLFQFYVADGKLSCQMYQRSSDNFLGNPYNVASYALLTHMMAKVTNLEVGEFIHAIGDGHIYLNHIEQVKTQLKREPYPLPNLEIARKVTEINDFKLEDFVLEGYQSHPEIKAEVSVG